MPTFLLRKRVHLLLAAVACLLQQKQATALLEEGQWEMAVPNVLLDSCQVDRFQDVTEFIPTTVVVRNVTSTGFGLDDNDFCSFEGLNFTCSEISFKERATQGADLILTTVFSGNVEEESTDSMAATMDVVIKRCDGWACFLLNSALDFPCYIELQTEAALL